MSSYLDTLTASTEVHGTHILAPESGTTILELRSKMAKLSWKDDDAAIAGMRDLFAATTDMTDAQCALVACRINEPEAREIMAACLDILGAGNRFREATAETPEKPEDESPTG